jgi:hypothetical protein
MKMPRIVKVKVITKAKQNKVVESKDLLKVYLNVPPQKGKANEKLKEILKDFFKTKKSQIEIIQGKFSSQKLIKINETS